MEAYCKGGQGPRRAVGPSKKKKKKKKKKKDIARAMELKRRGAVSSH